jgi:hypothetical protein
VWSLVIIIIIIIIVRMMYDCLPFCRNVYLLVRAATWAKAAASVRIWI